MSNKKTNTTKKENTVVAIIRIVLGLVFIFSSFVKGVDPLGTAYRVEDYLAAYNLMWLHGFEMALSVFLITIEFLIGIALVFKLQAKLATLGVVLILMIFIAITYFDAKYELVPDCGCFGDAVKLTGWETFYKNIVLLIMAFIVFFSRKSMMIKMAGWLQSLLMIVFAAGYLYFIFYNYNHLPMLDFREWKVGNNMISEGEDESVYYFTYKNKKTGELKEYISTEIPYQDTVWKAEWEFESRRDEIIEAEKKHNLEIENFKGTNFTKSIIERPGFGFLLISYDIETANGEAMLKIPGLIESTVNHDVNFVMLTASGPETLAKYFELYQLRYATFLADDIELKTMIRSNPGLVLMEDGVVVKKWHYNDFPENWKEAKLGRK